MRGMEGISSEMANLDEINLVETDYLSPGRTESDVGRDPGSRGSMQVAGEKGLSSSVVVEGFKRHHKNE